MSVMYRSKLRADMACQFTWPAFKQYH